MKPPLLMLALVCLALASCAEPFVFRSPWGDASRDTKGGGVVVIIPSPSAK